MEPPFVKWASEAYGMNLVYDGKQEEMVKLVRDSSTQKDLFDSRAVMGNEFRVLILQKKLKG